MAHPMPHPPPPPQKKLMSTKYHLDKYFEIHFEIVKMMEREQKQIKQIADVEPRVARGFFIRRDLGQLRKQQEFIS